MIQPATIGGLFITATDTAVGKTVVTAAIADWFRRHGRIPGVVKPVATGCQRRREGLVSEDAEILAHFADSRHPLDVICPQRYVEPLAPMIAADRAGEPLDWGAIDRTVRTIASDSDVLLVEGVGGLLVPLDAKHTVLDLIQWLRLPVVIVARAGLGTINHTLLTVRALRASGAGVAGVVINRYPAESPSVAEETGWRAIERLGKVPILAIVPEVKHPFGLAMPSDIAGAIDQCDWQAAAGGGREGREKVVGGRQEESRRKEGRR